MKCKYKTCSLFPFNKKYALIWIHEMANLFPFNYPSSSEYGSSKKVSHYMTCNTGFGNRSERYGMYCGMKLLLIIDNFNSINFIMWLSPQSRITHMHHPELKYIHRPILSLSLFIILICAFAC